MADREMPVGFSRFAPTILSTLCEKGVYEKFLFNGTRWTPIFISTAAPSLYISPLFIFPLFPYRFSWFCSNAPCRFYFPVVLYEETRVYYYLRKKIAIHFYATGSLFPFNLPSVLDFLFPCTYDAYKLHLAFYFLSFDIGLAYSLHFQDTSEKHYWIRTPWNPILQSNVLHIWW